MRETKLGSVQQQRGKEMISMHFAETAQQLADKRRMGSNRKKKPPSDFLKAVDKELKEASYKCGPDAIVHELAQSGEFEETRTTKTVYRYIKDGLMESKPEDMLRMSRLKRRKKRSSAPRPNKKVYGESIEKRPEAAAGRGEFGHWEGDLVIGEKSGDDDALLVLHERATREALIRRISSKEALTAKAAIDGIVDLYGREAFKTLTLDNGSEFSLMGREGVCFCHPYSSWEKGGIECHNAMIRRFFPKGVRIDSITDEQIIEAEEFINSLARRALGYRRPDELFEEALDRLYRAEAV